MHVFKYFFCLLKKNLGTMLLYLGIFLLLFLLISAQGESQVENFTEKKIDFTIVDRDQTALSAGMTDFMEQKHHRVTLKEDETVWKDALYYGDTQLLIIIPEGFTEAFQKEEPSVNIQYVNRPGYENSFVITQLESFLTTAGVYYRNGSSMETAVQKAMEKQKLETEVTMLTDAQMENSSFQYFFQYLPYLYISVIVNTLGMILILFQKQDIRNRNICGALSYRKQQLQIGAAGMILSVGVWLFMVVVFFVCGGAGELNTRMLYAHLNSLVFVLVSVSITYFISQLITKLQLLTPISTVLGLGMSFLCGVFVPQHYLGSSVLMVGKFLPAYWYVRLNNILFELENTGNSLMTDLAVCIGVQLLFVAAGFAAGMVAGKRKSA